MLLYLYAHRDRSHHVSDLVAELRSSELSIQTRLNDLYARGVLLRGDEPDRHRYVVVSEDFGRLVEELERINQSHAYGVIDAIFGRPQASVQSIADAFRIRGRKK